MSGCRWLSTDDSHCQERIAGSGKPGHKLAGRSGRRKVRVQAKVSNGQAGRQREQAETWPKDKPGVGRGGVQAWSEQIGYATGNQIR